MKRVIDFKTIYKLIPFNYKKKIPIFFFNNLIIIFLEILILGLIYSILKVLVKDDSFFQVYLEKYNLDSINYLLFFLILVFVVKNFLLIFLYHWQYKYTAHIQRDLSCNLLINYLFLEYSDYIKKNSAIYIRNVESECTRFSNYILSLLVLITETTILLSLIIYLLFLNFMVTFCIIILFSIICLAYFFLTKKRFETWGKERLFLSGAVIQSLIETFQNIKEIKVYGKEKLFYQRFKNFQKKMQNLAIKANLVRVSPKPILEILAITLVVIFLFLIETSNLNWIDYLPILSIYLVTFLRILPSSNKIFHNYQNIILNNPSIKILEEELKQSKILNNDIEDKINSERFEIQNISYGYEKTSPIIKNLSFIFEEDNIYGIFGDNGSGKTTLINIILGLIRPDSGKVIFYYKNKEINVSKVKFGYVPQNTVLIDSSISANIALEYDEREIDQQKIKNCINSSSMFDFINLLREKENTIVGENGVKISGGQKQRIGIARSLFNNSKIMILDEPTSALDKNQELKFIKELNELKKSRIIIIISHNENLKKYCNKLLQL